MITPQQIDQISFSQARHGYDMEQVDKILEPLTEDYVTLYKENALLKSKMRVLVGKLEEYRKNEAAAKDALDSAKRSAEQMMQEAEAKCAQMMRQAQAAAAAVPAAPAASAAKAPSADAFVAVENARVAEARKTAAARITEIQTQMQQCIQALDRIKNANVTPAAKAPAAAAPAAAAPAATAPAPAAPAPAEAPKAAAKKNVDVYDSDAVVGEISQSLEAMVGTTNDTAPKAAPQHPTRDTSTSRFSTLNLQFGRNYDPTQK